MAVEEGQKQKRTPFSARLPQASLNDVIPVVEALGELASPSTPHVIAQKLGTSYQTNARFRTRLGAAGYYGFIRKDGERRILTPRGEAVTSGDEDLIRQARREAVMSTTFGPIIHSLRGRNVSEDTIALRVQSDYGVPEGSAPGVATALVSAATQAELIDNGRFDAAVIEGLAQFMPSADDLQQANGGEAQLRPPKERPEKTARTASEVRKQTQTQKTNVLGKEEKQQPPFVPGVQVVVKIDASSLTPQQIAELIRALQAPSS